MVIQAARTLEQARESLKAALQATKHKDPDFPRLLKEVHDMKIVTASELAEWTGLSRGKMYDRIREVKD